MKHVIWGLCISIVLLGIRFNHTEAQDQPQTQETAETGQEPIVADQPLQIWTFVDDYRVITGKTLHLTVQVLWKLGVTVNLEGVEKINLSPFRIEGVTVGERQIFDNEHDFIVITYALSMPPNVSEGLYTIPSFPLFYINEVDKTEGKAVSSPTTVKKVPILVEGKVDRDVITIGDRICYTLTIRHEKNVRLLWENIEKLSFSPFEVLKKDRVIQSEGNIEKAVLTYTLSLYELGGKKKTPEVPGLTILYYHEPSNDAKKEAVRLETKETKTPPIPIILNSLLKAVDVPLEGLKGPKYYTKKDALLHGYAMMGAGAGLLLILGIMILRPLGKRLSAVPPKPMEETPKIAIERLKNAVTSFLFSGDDSVMREGIYTIDKALRIYLGALVGIPSMEAQSITTSNFLNSAHQKPLSEETAALTQTVLKQLDALIYGRHIDKETVEEMMRGIAEILRLADTAAA